MSDKEYTVNEEIHIMKLKIDTLEEKIDQEVVSAYKEAVKYGDLANGPYPSSDTIFTEVYESVPWHLKEQWDEMKKWSAE